MEKHIPKRMCVACRKMLPKSELIRVVCDIDDEKIKVDEKFKLFGRGAYVCKNEDCTALARKKKGFERQFKSRVESEIYDMCDNIAHTESP